MRNDSNTKYDPGNRREMLTTMAVSGVTLAVLIAAGYFAPTLLAAALH